MKRPGAKAAFIAEMTGESVLTDSLGRTLDYLRVSITDRCNLRCLYCMPPSGVQWKPHNDMLTFEEILRIIKIMAELGLRKIRVTGGEPLLRRGISSFIKNLKAVPNIEKVRLTTNGLLLNAYLKEAETLGDNSLPDGINISLDALDSGRYRRLTRGAFSGDESSAAGPEMILSIIDRLIEKKINVKINCVPLRAVNEEEISCVAALAKNKNIAVRFIELMPLGSSASFLPVTGNETAALIEKAFGKLIPFSGIEGSGPAVYYSLENFTGKIGFINPVTHGFCETCNRLRLTSEGFLKLCLSDDLGVDLRELIRNGAANDELSRVIIEAAAKKPHFHTLSGIYGNSENHTCGMFKIGG